MGVGMKPYLLRVMEPGSTEDVIEDFPSDLPFGPITKGDLLDLYQYQKTIGRPMLLRVIGVEHSLHVSDKSGLKHDIRVFTEAVPDTRESRLG